MNMFERLNNYGIEKKKWHEYKNRNYDEITAGESSFALEYAVSRIVRIIRYEILFSVLLLYKPALKVTRWPRQTVGPIFVKRKKRERKTCLSNNSNRVRVSSMQYLVSLRNYIISFCNDTVSMISFHNRNYSIDLENSIDRAK